MTSGHGIHCEGGVFSYTASGFDKEELRRKMNLWFNKTSVPSHPFSEICFHDNRM